MWVKRIFRRYIIDFLCLFLIVGAAAVARFVYLGSVPSNITGDEATNLIDVYRILLGKHLGPFSFAGDGTEALITVYWPVLFTFLTGMQNAIYALRISVSVLSIFALVGFYVVLRLKTNLFISLILTCLLGVNYVFLNFSRTGWVNMGVIFSGMFLLLFLELAERQKNFFWAVLAGFFAGMTFYGYHYGKILVIFLSVFLLSRFCLPMYRQREAVMWTGFFFAALLLMLLPFFITITKTKAYSLLARPKAVAIFSQDVTRDPQKFLTVAGNQGKLLFRGFFWLDGKVMSRGIENLRYVPLYSPPVDPVIKLLFWIALPFGLVFSWRSISFWWIVATSTLLTEFLTESVPNFARGLFYIPFIYLVVGIFLYRGFVFLRKSRGKKMVPYLAGLMIVMSVFLYYFNASYFLAWMGEKRMSLAREPAIENEEFAAWQQFQMDRMRVDELPVTTDEWQLLNE